MDTTPVFIWTEPLSRRWHDCPRAAWMQLFCGPPAPLLTKVETLPQHIVTIIRSVMHETLKTLPPGSPPPGADVLQQRALEQLRAQWRLSRANVTAWRQGRLPSAPCFMFLEHCRQTDLPRETTDAARDRLLEYAAACAGSQFWQEWQMLPAGSLLANGNEAEIALDCGGMRAAARFDSGTIYRDRSGKVHVMEWHGESGSADDFLQCCRIFHAMKQWQLPFEQLQCERILLNDGGRCRSSFVTKSALKACANKLKGEIRQIAALGEEEAAFPPAGVPGICEVCPFSPVCAGNSTME